MNKEEILARSRSENKNGDEMAQRVRERAYAVSAAVGGVACMLFNLTEAIFFDRSSIICWLIYGCMEFANALTGAVQTKSRKYIGLSCLIGGLTAGFLAVYIAEILAR